MPPLEICRPGPGPLWPMRKYGPGCADHFKSDNWSEKLLQYIVKDVGGHVERKVHHHHIACRFVGLVTCSGPINS
jgi:hypothetical protein